MHTLRKCEKPYFRLFLDISVFEVRVMVVLDNDSFLTALTKFFQQSRTIGTIWLTMKKCKSVQYCIHQIYTELVYLYGDPNLWVDNGSTKPKPRKRGKVRAGGSSSEPDEHLCLLRASNGKKHISTVVSDLWTFINIMIIIIITLF